MFTPTISTAANTLEIDQHAKINCEPNLKTPGPSSFFELEYRTAAQGGANMCNFDLGLRIGQSGGDWPHLAPYRVWGQYGGQPARGEW